MNMQWKHWPKWKKWGAVFAAFYLVMYCIAYVLIMVLDEALLVGIAFSFPSAPGILLFAPFSYFLNATLISNLIAYFLIGALIGKITSRKTVQKGPSPESKTKTLCFDIDGVIAAIEPNNEYDKTTPIVENIEIINALHDQGNRIILHTARGGLTGIDWSEVTRKQMKDWGVSYDELLFGKPAADHYIDDRAVPVEKIRTLYPPSTS